MSEARPPARAFRFGAFEVDFQARELRKRGVRLKLQDKPFQILALLLQRAGEVVTREELRDKLWSPDTYVIFDRSLNTAVNKLRQVLGDSPVNPRFVETLSRRGYRFIAPVEGPAEGVSRSAEAARAIDSIAVLPFLNASGDPEMEYLSDGITERLIQSLSLLPEIRVMARSTVFRFKGQSVDPQTVGRDLNIRAVLMGRLVLRGDTLNMDTELVDVDNGWRLWGEHYNRKLSDIFTVEEEISREISEKLRVRLSGEEKKRLAKRSTANVDAYRDYLKGRFHSARMTEEALRKSIEFYEQAIARDPEYALAYAGLSDSYSLFAYFALQAPLEVLPRAKAAAEKALELDDTLAEAHASVAGLRKVYDWDFASSEAAYRRSLELNPNGASVHHAFAALLSALGRAEEALSEIRRAQELDPLSLVFSMEEAWYLYMSREFKGAVKQSLKTLESEPSFAPALHTLGLAYEQLGKYDEAIAAFEKAKKFTGGHQATLAALGYAYAKTRRKREAMKIVQDLQKLSASTYVSPFWFAVVYSGLGEKDKSFEWLEKSAAERDVWLVWLKVTPRFDEMRSDPRFENLLRRVGFPSSKHQERKQAATR